MSVVRDRQPRRRPPSAVGTLADALQRALAGRALATGLSGWTAVERWSSIVGPRVAAHTTAVEYRDGTLWVEVDSASWLAELTATRRSVLETVTAALDGTPVKQIRFVPARQHVARAETGVGRQKGD